MTLTQFNGLPRPARIIIGAIVALAGGGLAHLTGIPLGWLVGSLLLSALFTVYGLDLAMTDTVRKFGQVVAGFCVGLFFTPEVGERIVDLGWLMVLTGLLSLLASAGLAMVFYRVADCDRKSAFFAMMPGGLAEMAGFAHQFGADTTLISVSQTLRVITIVLTLPPLLLLLDGAPRGPVTEHLIMGPWLVAAGLGLSAVSAIALQRLRIFNPWLLGGIFVGIAFGILPDQHVYAPQVLRSLAQIAIGAALGARFRWGVLKAAGIRFVPASLAFTLMLMGFNAAMAFAAWRFIDISTALLATAPGGIAEMSLTAEAMRLAPPLVTAWQLVRILIVALFTGPLFKLYDRHHALKDDRGNPAA